MSKWKRDEKVLVGGLSLIAALCFGALIAATINALCGEEVGRDAPKDFPYSYCAQWQSAYKSQTCVRYGYAIEKRVIIHKHGLWWDYDTYIVVQ